MIDYSTYYHPDRSRKLRQLLADRKWEKVWEIARDEQKAMGQLVLLAQAEIAQAKASKLIAQLETSE